MASLRISLARRADGSVVFRCTRPDGSATWQTHEPATARFFPAHDLTHYAVETTVGLRDAFYGLTLAGWSLTDYGAPWPRGPLPPEALAAEVIVGFLDQERAGMAAGGDRWSAADFTAHAATHYAERGHANPPSLDDATLDRVRAARDALLSRWAAVPIGGTLELTFDDDSTGARS